MVGGINNIGGIGSPFRVAGNLPVNNPDERVEFFSVKNPFESFLKAAVDHLSEVSMAEFKANSIAEDYIRGKASVEDAVLSMGKAREKIRFTTAVVNNMVTSFKELQQMQI